MAAKYTGSSPVTGEYFPAGQQKKIIVYYSNPDDELWDRYSYADLYYSSDGDDLALEGTFNPSGWNDGTYEFTITFNPTRSRPIAIIVAHAYSVRIRDFVDSKSITYYPYTLCTATPTNVLVDNVSSKSVGPSTNVTLSWTPPTAGINNSIAGYNVYRSSSSGGPYTIINSTLITGTSYIVTSPDSSGSYYYKVTAYNSRAEDASSKETSQSSSYATLTTTYSSPSAPKNLTISATQVRRGSTITVGWEVPDSAGLNNSIYGYRIYYMDAYDDSYHHYGDVSASVQRVELWPSQTTGMTRYFYVTALGTISGTESSESNVVSVTTKGGTIKYHNGTSWVECEVRYHNGTQWVECEPRYHDGTSWKEVSS